LGSGSGGSIRIPANFCGIYGYKPSSKRLIMRGQAKGVPTWDGIRNLVSCYGPMGK
jgi:Asp-tRNA(Asn)/Glu-tRNA(Gln) amidotransferase A subunit family amidase